MQAQMVVLLSAEEANKAQVPIQNGDAIPIYVPMFPSLGSYPQTLVLGRALIRDLPPTPSNPTTKATRQPATNSNRAARQSGSKRSPQDGR